MQCPGRYLTYFGGTVIVLTLLTVAFTVAVDPYYIMGSKAIAGWNWIKPVANDRAAAAKTYLLERARPRTLLLGNSRIEIGFDPDSPEWPTPFRPVFNAGLAGRDLSIAAKILEDSLAVPGLRNVVVGVDFFDFLQVDTEPAMPGPVDAGPDQERMRVGPDLTANPEQCRARWRDMFGATLSLDAVIGSVATVLAQFGTADTTLTPAGHNPLNEYRSYVKEHGFRDLFDQKQAMYEARFALSPHPDYAVPERQSGFRALREILVTAGHHDVTVTLIIYPYHAQLMDLLRKDGLWNSFEAWKRALVQVVADFAGTQRVRIVDFSGYNGFTTELVPEAGDVRHEVHWYWEAGHFRPALGNLMIRRLYGDVNDSNLFGRDLTLSTINSVIISMREEAATSLRK
jgi:hypothetical protein